MEFITQALAFLYSAEFGSWISAVTGVIVAANAITVLTPTTADNKILNGILAVLNFIAMNFGKNKNADAK
jgi:hypothetical protein